LNIIEKILCSNHHLLPNELFLFNLVRNQKELLKFVFYPALDFEDLSSFFYHLKFTDLTFELFEQFKRLINFNEIPSQRWNFPHPRILCLKYIPLCQAKIEKLIFEKSISFNQNIDQFITRYHDLEDHLKLVTENNMKIKRPSFKLCSYRKYKREYVYQPFWRCNTCGLTGNLGCCQVCRVTCHYGHNLTFAGDTNCFCDCGAGIGSTHCFCMQDNTLSSCTFLQTNISPKSQPMWECKTCGLKRSSGCCQPCIINCHSGHNIKFIGLIIDYCHCKLKSRYCKCNCVK
jgi:hypothetical protein